MERLFCHPELLNDFLFAHEAWEVTVVNKIQLKIPIKMRVGFCLRLGLVGFFGCFFGVCWFFGVLFFLCVCVGFFVVLFCFKFHCTPWMVSLQKFWSDPNLYPWLLCWKSKKYLCMSFSGYRYSRNRFQVHSELLFFLLLFFFIWVFEPESI